MISAQLAHIRNFESWISLLRNQAIERIRPMTYDDALNIRKKWTDGAYAEQLGFQSARYEDKPRLMSQNEYLQQRYLQGFHDAKAILAQG